MQILAGILLAWSIIYVIISATLAAVYVRFGRNSDYLVFAWLCLLLTVHATCSSLYYLATERQSIILPGRIMMAALPLASAALLSLSMRLRRLPARPRGMLELVSHSLAIAFAVSSMAGFCHDYSHPVKTSILAIGPVNAIAEFSLSTMGFLLSSFSLVIALVSCFFLVMSFRGDRLVQWFFGVASMALLLFSVNDILLHAQIIRSIYVVEHGLFITTFVVLAGFLREFERSRRDLVARTASLEEANRSLAELNQILTERTVTLDRVSDETRRLRPMADMGRMSASLAHEIRNPLAVLSNVAASLRCLDRKSSVHKEYGVLVEMLQEETDRLARLVDDLLLFSQSGRFSHAPVNPAVIVAMAVSEIRESVRQSMSSDLVIEVEVAPDLPDLTGSGDSLRSALVNLIQNAVQSSSGQGTVRVTAKQEMDTEATILFGVQDQAGGIPQGIVASIFEPFFSTRPTGTGLGLPIVKSIVESHDGEILVENKPGIGAAFWIRIPVSRGTGLCTRRS